MAYRIVETRHRAFPDDSVVTAALASASVGLAQVLDAFATYRCPLPPILGQGYQVVLADHLERYLADTLRFDGTSVARGRHELTYSPTLKQHADFGLIALQSKRRILFEIEFRPNYEKDLVKFQIGANTNTLLVGIMVLALDRKSINPAYTSMPEFGAAAEVIEQFRPRFPMLLVGIRGEHLPSPHQLGAGNPEVVP